MELNTRLAACLYIILMKTPRYSNGSHLSTEQRKTAMVVDAMYVVCNLLFHNNETDATRIILLKMFLLLL